MKGVDNRFQKHSFSKIIREEESRFSENVVRFMKTILKKAAALLTSAAVMLSASPMVSYAAMDTSEFDSGYTYSTEMRGLTAFQIASDMGAGWNLGNSLESVDNETNWGNPTTTKAMIDAIADKGFTTLRVPVRWDDHYSNASSYTIQDNYMDRVETVVNYGLANDMYVILNVHHNDLQHNVPDTDAISAELSAIWTQIGNRFKNYGDKLIFEVNNEPRSQNDWTGNAEYYACVNDCNEAARAAIRATGGNNTERLVMLPTYCASADEAKAAAWTKNASDDMIAASIHAYLPFDFAFNGEGHTTWLESDVAELNSFFDRLDTYFLSKGIPVVIGEFGNCNKNNTADRVTCTEVYTSLARQFAEQNIPCVVWDNNCYEVGEENFGLFNRSSRTFTYEGIVNALVSAYDGDPDYEVSCSAETVISSTGGSTTGSWGQAVCFSGGLIKSMSQGESVYAEYSSSKAPELILQSLSVSDKGWVKVPPDSTSDGVAVWSYSTIVNYYGEGFVGLDNVFIGDTGAALTVSKVYINNPNAHTHNYNGAETVTLEASETTKGRMTVACSVSGCDKFRVVETDYASGCAHTGGTATCKDKAICGLCGKPYGKVDSTNHTSVAENYSFDESGHWYECGGCGADVDKSSHSSSGAATETTAETCTVCGYVITPALGHTTHTADTSKWLYDETSHWHKCIGCEEKLDVKKHSGGTASCNAKAVCEICSQSYGNMDSSNHIGIEEEWSSDQTHHWHECNDCGSDIDKATHKKASAYQKNETGHWKSCTVCGTGEAYAENHTSDEGVVTVEPTADSEGLRTYSCTVCDYVIRTESIPKLQALVKVSDGTEEKKFTDLKSALKAYASSSESLTITLLDDVSVKSVALPKKAESITITGSGTLSISGTSLSIPASTTINTDIIGSGTKPLAIKISAGKTLNLNGNITNLGALSGTKTSVLNANTNLTAASLATFKEVNIADNAVLTVNGKVSAVLLLNGKLNLTNAKSTAAITTAGTASLVLSESNGVIPKVTINDVTDSLELKVVDSEGNTILLENGTAVLFAAGKTDYTDKVTVVNKNQSSLVLTPFMYGKEIRAEYADTISLYDGTTRKNFPNLSAALNAIKESSKDYVLTLNDDQTVNTLKLPKTANSITIDGDGALNIAAASVAIPVNMTIEADLNGTGKKPFALKAAAGKTLTLGGTVTNLGALSGTKTSLLNVNTDLTAASLATFKEVNIAEDAVLTINGKVSAISLLNGKLKLTNAKTAAALTAGDAEIVLISGNFPKVTVADALENLTVTVVDENGEEADLASGTAVIYSGGKNKFTDKITITNKTANGLDLDPFIYGKEIRAEYADAITLSGGGNGNYPNLEKTFEAITDATKDYVITLNSDISAAKLAVPKTANSVTIRSNGECRTINLLNVSSVTSATELILENVRIESTKPYALTASKSLTLENFVSESVKSVKGGAKFSLNLGECSTIPSVTGFGTINVKDDYAIGTAFTTTTLNLCENAGIIVPGTKSTVSAKFLNGETGSYIKLEQGFTPIKLSGTSNDCITGTIKLVADTEIASDTPVFAAKYAGNNVFDPSGAVAASEYGHTVSIVGGKAYIKPILLDLNGSRYALWADAVSAIEAENSGADYTLTLLDNYDAEGALKFPKAGTYNSITVSSANKLLTFTGGITATGELIISDTSLISVNSKDVSVKYSVNAGKYSLTAVNADFGLASGITSSADVTLRSTVLNGNVKAAALNLENGNLISGTVTATLLNLSGNNTVLNTIQTASLNASDAGAKLNLLYGKYLNVTQNGIAVDSEQITLRLIDANGNAVSAESGTVISTKFIGSTDKLLLDAENGSLTISCSKNKLILENPYEAESLDENISEEEITAPDIETEDDIAEDGDNSESDTSEIDDDTSEDDVSEIGGDTSDDDVSEIEGDTSDDDVSEIDDIINTDETQAA